MSNYSHDPDGRATLDLSSIGRTNVVYSEEEEAYIRSVLQDALQRGGDVSDLVERCKIALAPHKKLPPDVLRLIFQICNEGRVQLPLASLKTSANSCVFRITHVCSAWRRLAIGMPELWGNISIKLKYPHWARRHATLAFAKEWFDRAQGMRRSLSVQLPQSHAPRSDDLWKRVLEFIAAYRLAELELRYPINDLALTLPDHAWPSLECLTLSGNVPDDMSSGQKLFSMFGKLSNLRHLIVYDCHDLDDMDQVVPWHQLRTLDITSFVASEVTPSLLLHVLRQTPLLESCGVSLGQFVPAIPREEKIVLANMDYFRLNIQDDSSSPEVLQHLVLPNVTSFIIQRDMSLHIDDGKLTCDMPILMDLIQRSGGMRRLRDLTLEVSSPLLDVGIFLELLPSLEYVSITSGYLTSDVINRLSSGKLGPRLCELALKGAPQDADQILSMVESRYQNAKKISESEQIESGFCPFQDISISCAPFENLKFYRDKIASLSKKYDCIIHLFAL